MDEKGREEQENDHKSSIKQGHLDEAPFPCPFQTFFNGVV